MIRQPAKRARGMIAALAAIVLAGCQAVQPVAKFAGADAGNAAAMAKGDSADPQAAGRAACYQAWANLAGGIGAVPADSAGVFTMVEAGIEVQSTLQLPSCQAVAGQVVLWALRKAPIGGNLLP